MEDTTGPLGTNRPTEADFGVPHIDLFDHLCRVKLETIYRFFFMFLLHVVSMFFMFLFIAFSVFPCCCMFFVHVVFYEFLTGS